VRAIHDGERHRRSVLGYDNRAREAGRSCERSKHVFKHVEREVAAQFLRQRLAQPKLGVGRIFDGDDRPDIRAAAHESLTSARSSSANASTAFASASRSASVDIRMAAFATRMFCDETSPSLLSTTKRSINPS